MTGRSPLLDALLDIAEIPDAAIPARTRAFGRFSLFDWAVVARAGRDEPVGRILRDYVLSEGGAPVATLFGGGKAPARAAALVNGAISHALDYDDTHFGHVAHPSVAIAPAVMALAEGRGASLEQSLVAFLLGAEASCRFGLALGRAHYERGFHQTATAGAIGATVAAGRICGLSRDEMANALSLVGTRASGLISQFGTMGKPMNAGIAASNGVEAAELARRGFVSADDGLVGPQGFLATHSDAPKLDEALADLPPARFLFDDIKYKLHACCHGTHAMIEGLAAALSSEPVAPDGIAQVEIATNPRWLNVCDKKAPRTGLEVKFSYAWLAGMMAHGVDTSADRVYTAALAADPRLVAFAKRVTVAGDATVSDTATRGALVLADGRRLPFAHDLASPLPEAAIEAGLRRKAAALLGEDAADRLWALVADPATPAADLVRA